MHNIFIFSIFAAKFQTVMPSVYTLDIRVDPLVAGWMERSFKKVRGVYRMGDSCYYGLVSAMLYQSHVRTPSVIPEKYASFVHVKIAITEFDFYHYGWEVSILQELRFSRIIRHLLIDSCLRNVAIIRSRYNIPLSQAISRYMVYYGIEEEQVRFETLRKIYRRKYLAIEEEYRDLDRAAVTDFGLNNDMPAPKKLKIRMRQSNPLQTELFSQPKRT